MIRSQKCNSFRLTKLAFIQSGGRDESKSVQFDVETFPYLFWLKMLEICLSPSNLIFEASRTGSFDILV